MRFVLISASGNGQSVVARAFFRSLHIPVTPIGEKLRELAEDSYRSEAEVARSGK